jgi:hypothetical protein
MEKRIHSAPWRKRKNGSGKPSAKKRKSWRKRGRKLSVLNGKHEMRMVTTNDTGIGTVRAHGLLTRATIMNVPRVDKNVWILDLVHPLPDCGMNLTVLIALEKWKESENETEGVGTRITTDMGPADDNTMLIHFLQFALSLSK